MTRQTVGNEERDGDLTVAGDLSVSGSVANPTISGVLSVDAGEQTSASARNPQIQTHSNISGALGATQLFTWRDSATIFSLLEFYKSRSSTIGSHTTTQNGEDLGAINWLGSDGTSFAQSARILAEVDAAPSSGIVPGRLTYFTANSSGTLTERMRIDSNGLITGTGTSLGAWTAYTPTLSTWALGSGTASGAYCQIGKTVLFRAVITLAADSTISATTSPSISLPVTAIGGTSGAFTFCARFFDSSLAAYYEAVARLASTTTVVLNTAGTNNVHNATTTTVPFTWATGDALILAGTYQAA